MQQHFKGIAIVDVPEVDTEHISLEMGSFEQLQTSGYGAYDFLLCAEGCKHRLESLEGEGVVLPFVICMVEEGTNTQEEPPLFDAWVSAQEQSLGENLYDVCRQSRREMDRIALLRRAGAQLASQGYLSRLNEQNLQMIKTKMQHSTSEIRGIFKSEIERMRSVYADLEATRHTIAKLQDQSKEDLILAQSIDRTEDILARTGDIIKNMHGFVGILQCEDRISQMIDGIVCVLSREFEMDGTLDATKEQEIKARVMECYSIQEQRDMLMDKEVDMKGCENTESEEEEFTLF